MTNNMDETMLEEIIETLYSSDVREKYMRFGSNVTSFFMENQELSDVIHTVKYRVKSPKSLKNKIKRKADKVSSCDSWYKVITDLVGVRVLVLFTHELKKIHESIESNINADGFQYFEEPKAYTWDPETMRFLSDIGLKCESKDSLYTSLHYVVKPNTDSFLTCEIQVRTLYEEIWGEIDHLINYPTPSSNPHCVEQIKVLARLTTTGTKLLDSIWNSFSPEDHK